jgi:membrane protein implicated in regulation of membrane protease activity
MKLEYWYVLAQFALTFGIFTLVGGKLMSWQWWATIALTAGLMIVSYRYGWHQAERMYEKH